MQQDKQEEILKRLKSLERGLEQTHMTVDRTICRQLEEIITTLSLEYPESWEKASQWVNENHRDQTNKKDF